MRGCWLEIRKWGPNLAEGWTFKSKDFGGSLLHHSLPMKMSILSLSSGEWIWWETTEGKERRHAWHFDMMARQRHTPHTTNCTARNWWRLASNSRDISHSCQQPTNVLAASFTFHLDAAGKALLLLFSTNSVVNHSVNLFQNFLKNNLDEPKDTTENPENLCQIALKKGVKDCFRRMGLEKTGSRFQEGFWACF